MPISIRPAKGLKDFLFLRNLRNDSREYMTGSQEKISLLAQFRFWRSKPEVYIAEISGVRVGYLLLKGDFITECVSPKYRGFGIGAELVRYAQGLRETLIAVIRLDNIRSICLHRTAGFEWVPAFVEKGTLTYCYHRKVWQNTEVRTGVASSPMSNRIRAVNGNRKLRRPQDSN